MMDIDSSRLHVALTALGEQLRALGSTAHLVVIGGSGLLAINAISRATQDVDVVALRERDLLVSAEPLPDDVLTAAALVARDLGLASSWLNADPASLLRLGLPDGLVERLTVRSYGQNLSVSFAARIDQIFFKLYAAADRAEPRDFADLERLAPTPAELHAAARWARTHNMPGPFDEAMAHTLARLGVEDDGRDA